MQPKTSTTYSAGTDTAIGWIQHERVAGIDLAVAMVTVEDERGPLVLVHRHSRKPVPVVNVHGYLVFATPGGGRYVSSRRAPVPPRRVEATE